MARHHSMPHMPLHMSKHISVYMARHGNGNATIHARMSRMSEHMSTLIHMSVHMSTCISIHIPENTCLYTRLYTYLCTCPFTRLYTCPYACLYTCLHASATCLRGLCICVASAHMSTLVCAHMGLHTCLNRRPTSARCVLHTDGQLHSARLFFLHSAGFGG